MNKTVCRYLTFLLMMLLILTGICLIVFSIYLAVIGHLLGFLFAFITGNMLIFISIKIDLKYE